MAKEIILNSGNISIIDEDDYEKLSKYKWSENAYGYAFRQIYSGYKINKNGKITVVTKIIYLAREIANTPKGMQVDHINRNRLDNRKCNLRNVTQKIQLLNKGMYSNNKSGYKGVVKGSKNRYRAYISKDGKREYIGFFKTAEEAAMAYDAAAKKYFGEFAFLNFTN